MRPSRARSSGAAASCQMLSSVDCITATFESEFLVHTGGCFNSQETARKQPGSQPRLPRGSFPVEGFWQSGLPPLILKAMAIIRPETLARWHRAGFRRYWQNSFAERLIGTIRRECVDHIIVLGEAHLRRTLREYARYYNTARTHRSLDQDAPVSRPVQRFGRIVSHAVFGGLHHQYVRI